VSAETAYLGFSGCPVWGVRSTVTLSRYNNKTNMSACSPLLLTSEILPENWWWELFWACGDSVGTKNLVDRFFFDPAFWIGQLFHCIERLCFWWRIVCGQKVRGQFKRRGRKVGYCIERLYFWWRIVCGQKVRGQFKRRGPREGVTMGYWCSF